MINKKQIKMVEDLQCPGCTLGSDTKCGSFKADDFGLKCQNHSAGTFLFGIGRILLGFPKGFNRIGESDTSVIKFFNEVSDSWGANVKDLFDFPVWKAKHDGRIFLRVVSPRVGRVQIHVIDSEEGFESINCLDVTDLDMD